MSEATETKLQADPILGVSRDGLKTYIGRISDTRETLADIRLSFNMTPVEMDDMLGLSSGTYEKWEDEIFEEEPSKLEFLAIVMIAGRGFVYLNNDTRDEQSMRPIANHEDAADQSGQEATKRHRKNRYALATATRQMRDAFENAKGKSPDEFQELMMRARLGSRVFAQQRLAEALHVGQSTVSNWINGETEIPAWAWFALRQMLGEAPSLSDYWQQARKWLALDVDEDVFGQYQEAVLVAENTAEIISSLEPMLSKLQTALGGMEFLAGLEAKEKSIKS